ncbi:MAG: hypothetical protein JWO39_2634 [Gemmatimonadetes bacterium]|nr:hypothetical protein [Gemmatimonadota bacterium]
MIEGQIRSRFARRLTAGLGILGAMLASIACERAALVPHARPLTVDTARTVGQSDGALRFPLVPDPAKTPGEVLDVTAADVCVSGYSKRVRDVPIEVKRRAYASYGIRTHEPGEYEVDHLVSLSLGGSNSIRNLWPQSFRTSPWNAYVKDVLEDELHRRVCAGTLDLRKAQQVIAHDWVSGYRTYVHAYPPPARPHTRNRHRQRYTPRPQPGAEAPVS